MKAYFFCKADFKFHVNRTILGLLILLSIPSISYGKSPSKLRKFLNPIHFSFSMGYGRTYYNNQTVNIAVYERDGNLYLYNPSDNQVSYLIRWFGNSYVRMKAYEDPDFLELLSNANNNLPRYVTFDGFGNTLPFTFSGHIDILRKFRLELGGALYLNFIKTLRPDDKHKDLIDYNDPKGLHYTVKIYVMPSFKLLENSAYTLLINAQAGFNFSYGNVIKDVGAIHNMLFPVPAGIGITLEKHISEYFSVFGRILYEHHTANDRFGATSSNGLLLSQQSVFLQIGLTINCPEIPICPYPDCNVAVKHKHLDTPYRGVSMFKGKNSLGYRLYDK